MGHACMHARVCVRQRSAQQCWIVTLAIWRHASAWRACTDASPGCGVSAHGRAASGAGVAAECSPEAGRDGDGVCANCHCATRRANSVVNHRAQNETSPIQQRATPAQQQRLLCVVVTRLAIPANIYVQKAQMPRGWMHACTWGAEKGMQRGLPAMAWQCTAGWHGLWGTMTSTIS